MGKEQKIKCVVWDLDNTLWDGVILEDSNVVLKQDVVEIIKKLDERGILHSIASKNEPSLAMSKLEEFGISEYFLYPQINWNPKSESIKNIAKSINIGIDTLVFVDDQPFEREEVNFVHPEVLCIDALNLEGVLDMPELKPKFITEDSKIRRQMYMNDIKRNNIEENFSGPHEEFLASLNMKVTIAPVQENDLQRVEELTVRTHQLNTTGYTYSYEELDVMRHSDRHKLFVVGLDDKYGTYGKVGVVMLECVEDVWTVKLLLMSCRVMSRGIGSLLINYILKLAKENNVKLMAEFVKTDRNKMMYATYKFAGFTEYSVEGDKVVFEHNLSNIQDFPEYVHIKTLETV
ncbi:FkbH [Lysinibacillus xylanilyticus]|uniref:FkbH n=1 Tax=Lysinibacillus xylanilyticus TaxID=582475 RepID=A0A0K9FBL5_9BACI|nr:HAD-IIIC family phosphatase [Lysinibacillus xylanilyticus]KMY31608.1 FkbH [Lysinibacillus xylanilyticus]